MKTSARRHAQGSALVTMMIILLLVSLAGAALVGFAKHQTHSMARVRDYMKAQAYAEAGGNEAYNRLKSDFDLRDDPSAFPPHTYGDGGFDADVTPVGTAQALITSIGQCGPVTARIKMDIKDVTRGEEGYDVNTPQGAYACAVVSGRQMTWNGTAITRVLGGRVHSNDKYKMTGGQIIEGNVSARVEVWSTGDTEIQGDAAAPEWKGKSPTNITGTVTTGPVPLVPLPPLDLTPYYNQALANGQVYNGNQHFMGSADYVPPGGVLWVNGDFQWSGSGRMIGCFIATGDIKWSGSGDQIKVNDYPAVISRDGDIDISGSGKFHGLIYAMTGDFDKSGSGDVVGSIFCAGEFDKSGSWNLLTYEDSTPTPPDQEGRPPTESDIVVVTAWQE